MDASDASDNLPWNASASCWRSHPTPGAPPPPPAAASAATSREAADSSDSDAADKWWLQPPRDTSHLDSPSRAKRRARARADLIRLVVGHEDEIPGQKTCEGSLRSMGTFLSMRRFRNCMRSAMNEALLSILLCQNVLFLVVKTLCLVAHIQRKLYSPYPAGGFL